MRVLVHQDVIDSDVGDLDLLLAKVGDAVKRRLELTSGSTLKVLRGPFDGAAMRLRAGSLRLPLSIVSVNGEVVVAVHQAEHRRLVYTTPEFAKRLHYFHEELFDAHSRSWRSPPENAGYIEMAVGTNAQEAATDTALEPWLSTEQARVLDGLLPFPATWGAADAILMTAKGPPGSGKTLVASELAITAASVCEYDVLVLAPTPKLVATYGQWLQGQPGISVELVQEFFQDRLGNPIAERERERHLSKWWSAVTRLPAVRQWVTRYPVVRTPRFLRLVDGLLTGELDAVVGSRDALDAADAGLYEPLHILRGKRTWMDTLAELQQEFEVTLRCQAAGASVDAPVEGSSRPLLLIVDECQDLVPEEWRALIDLVDVRRRVDHQTRIAMLGDEAQRITPTSFSWADVTSYAIATLGWPRGAVREVVLPGSFRVPKAIGDAAGRVFGAPLADLAAGRHPEILNSETLPPGGTIHILSYPSHGNELDYVQRMVLDGRVDSDQAMILVDADDSMDGPDAPLSEVSERLPIALAKGLEFAGVVVRPPFRLGLPMHFDRAAALYTALTRATDRVVLLVDDAIFPKVSEALGETISSVSLLRTSSGRAKAANLLLDLIGATSRDEQANVRAAKLHADIEEARLVTDSGDLRRLGESILENAGALSRLGALERLGQDFCSELVGMPELAAELRRQSGVHPRLATISSLLLGDHLAAERGLTHLELPPDEVLKAKEQIAHSLTPLERVVIESSGNADASTVFARAIIEGLSAPMVDRSSLGDEPAPTSSFHEGELRAMLVAMREAAAVTVGDVENRTLFEHELGLLKRLGTRLDNLETRVARVAASAISIP